MASPLLPYTAEHYNSLLELLEAKDQFKFMGASEILSTRFGPVLVKHHVEGILGVVLLQNQNERLVGLGSANVLCAGKPPNVAASSWRFIGESIVPYEFVCSDAKTFLAQTQPFLAEFRARINEWETGQHFWYLVFSQEESISGPVTPEKNQYCILIHDAHGLLSTIAVKSRLD
jgi:hypothetical protein